MINGYRMQRPGHWPYLLCAVFLVCTMGTSAADRPKLTDEFPDWMIESMANESRAKKPRRVELEGDDVILKVTGKITSKPKQDYPHFWHFQVDFGAEQDAHCWVTTELQFMYDALVSTADNMLQAVAESYEDGAIESSEVYFIEAGFMEEIPFAVLERLYVLAVADEVAVGLQKARAAQRGDVTFVCEHNELGYIESFERLFQTLVLEAEIETSRDKPYYEEHRVLHFDGQPAGTTTVTMMLDADGDTQTRINTGMLIGAGDMTEVVEYARVEYSSPQGQMITAVYAEVASDDTFRQLQLTATDEGIWQVQGTETGNEVSYTLGSHDNLLSTLGQMYAVKGALFDPTVNSIEAKIWHPETDATQWLVSKVTFDNVVWKGTRAITTVGPLSMSTLYDGSGSAVSSAVDLQGLIFSTERVLLRGAVRAPIAP